MKLSKLSLNYVLTICPATCQPERRRLLRKMSVSPIITFKAGQCEIDVSLPDTFPVHELTPFTDIKQTI